MTSAQLADELEVSQRTILRDLDAMTEAGLPVIVYQGSEGGIELGFNYRTRLTALTEDEAEAIGIMLASPHPALELLDRARSARRAASKIIEQQSETVRAVIAKSQSAFELNIPFDTASDPRPAAIAKAVRAKTWVNLRSRSTSPEKIAPIAMTFATDGNWTVRCGLTDKIFQQADWGDISVSAKNF
jgi:predicted DNA-binding transcriptional regulator YafY